MNPGGLLKGKPQETGLWAVAVPIYLGSAAYLIFSGLWNQPLYDPRPAVNLVLRLLVMDLLPILWVLPWFWGRIPPAKGFPRNLWRLGIGRPLFLTAPCLAVVLFFLESFREVWNPKDATPASWGAVLWMQAAAALVTAIVLGAGTGLFEGKKRTTAMGSLPLWASRFLFLMLTAGGLVFHLSTGCDISRLLALIGTVSIVAQHFLGFLPRPRRK